MADSALAQVLGISANMVFKRRRVLGIEAHRARAGQNEAVDALLEHMADVEIAQLLGISAAVVYRRRKRHEALSGKAVVAPRAQRTIHSLADAEEAARARGGICLGKKSGGLLRWQCAFGHIFEATAHRVIRRRQWCGRCSGQVK